MITAFARQCAFLAGCFLMLHQPLAASETRMASIGAMTLPDVGERIVGSGTAGVALNGVDVVAYFAIGKATTGKESYELHHEGAVWRFASQANREAFASHPDEYMPVFGGYDPVAVSQGRPLAGLPEHFAIVEGRLVLFASALSRNQLVSEPDLLAQANAKWPDVETQLTR